MQLTLNQTEIVAAIIASVRTAVSVNDSMDVHVELKATRGDNGYSAIIDILPAGAERQNPQGNANKVKATRAYTKRATAAPAPENAAAEVVEVPQEDPAPAQEVEEAVEESVVEAAPAEVEEQVEVVKPAPKISIAPATKAATPTASAAAPAARPSLFAGLKK